MALDPKIWGPKYWFMLHTITLTYPHYPNDVTKKKYYDFIQNIPLFIPNEVISNEFIKLLDLYPIKPYLDNRDSFVRWMHFIHNKINEKLEKPKISLNDFYVNYYNNYKSQDIKIKEMSKIKEKLFFGTFAVSLCGLIIYLYNK